jgi:hypothetical protein
VELCFTKSRGNGEQIKTKKKKFTLNDQNVSVARQNWEITHCYEAIQSRVIQGCCGVWHRGRLGGCGIISTSAVQLCRASEELETTLLNVS